MDDLETSAEGINPAVANSAGKLYKCLISGEISLSPNSLRNAVEYIRNAGLESEYREITKKYLGR